MKNLLTGFAFVLSTTAFAQSGPPSNGLWYYQLGGAQPVRAAPNPDVTSISLTGSGDLSLGYSCGKIDPVASIAHSLNQVKDGVDNAVRAMVTAATGALASLPALILQRANPSLYEMMQNSLIRAEWQLDVATKSCEQIEAAISQGGNPYQDLLVLSQGSAWKKELGFGSSVATTAAKNANSNGGEQGVPWIYGTAAGGDGQDAIELTADLVTAGYNTTLNRTLSDTSDPTSSQPISELWENPEEAATWTAEVFGERTLTTCDSCTQESVPGVGLLPVVADAQEDLLASLETLVDASTPPNQTQLAAISAPGVAVTREVIDALKQLPAHEQALFEQRLASDVAVSRVLEKALYARHLLNVGKQVPEAIAIGSVQTAADEMIANIDTATQRLVFEHQARKTVVSETAASILQRNEERQRYSLSFPEKGYRETGPLIQGRVED